MQGKLKVVNGSCGIDELIVKVGPVLLSKMHWSRFISRISLSNLSKSHTCICTCFSRSRYQPNILQSCVCLRHGWFLVILCIVYACTYNAYCNLQRESSIAYSRIQILDPFKVFIQHFSSSPDNGASWKRWKIDRR